jgi:hypothetical protein
MELSFISGNLSIHESNGECNDPEVDPWKQRFAVGESDLCSEVKKFTAKRRPETTLPTWTSAAGL